MRSRRRLPQLNAAHQADASAYTEGRDPRPPPPRRLCVEWRHQAQGSSPQTQARRGPFWNST